MKRYIINILLCLALFCNMSCKTPHMEIVEKSDIIQKFRWSQADSTLLSSTSGDISWKSFFPDSNLVHLINTALILNSDYMQAIQQIEIARITYKTNRMATLPSLDLNLGSVTQKESANISVASFPNSNKAYNDFQLSLSSSWEVDIWGKLSSQKKASGARLLATQTGAKFVQTQIISEIAKAYYELMAYDEQLLLIEKNLRLEATALDIVNVQKQAGKATALAIQQFEAQLYNTRSQKCYISRMIANTENYLNTLIGRYPQPVIRSRYITKQNFDPKFQIGIPVQLLDRRPDIIEASYLLSAAGFDVQSARKAFYPSLTISPTMGFAASNASLLFNHSSLLWNITNGIVAPVFKQNQLRGNYKIKVAEQKQALIAYEKILRQSVTEVQNAIISLRTLNAEIDNKVKELDALDNAVSTSHNLYAYGYATYLEVISAQKTVRDAELELVNIHKEKIFAIIDLYRSLGGGKF